MGLTHGLLNLRVWDMLGRLEHKRQNKTGLNFIDIGGHQAYLARDLDCMKLLKVKTQPAPENQWLELELEGSRSNRSAIGAQVRVFWNGQQQLQEVSGGSGFCAQNQRRLHFGLCKNARVERVEILWPSGQKQTLTAPEVGKLHHVKEPESSQGKPDGV